MGDCINLPFEIVGVGASAGGLESIERFLTCVEKDSGRAYVFIQHLSPNFKSFMGDILSRKTEIPIATVEDGLRIKPNRIYLLPPRKNLGIRAGAFEMKDMTKQIGVPHKPIDSFFKSLAKNLQTRAFAVVLSGTGSDGTEGVREISAFGGRVFIESPETAKFNGMPVNALANNLSTFVGSPEEIAFEISHSNSRSADSASGEAPAVANSEKTCPEREKIFELVRRKYEVDFASYKISTIDRRITKRLQSLNIANLSSYVDYLKNNDGEVAKLYYEMLIGVTRFFRDEDAFKILKNQVIPVIYDRAQPNEEIRIWVPGVASGEEAYSIAILFFEYAEHSSTKPNIKIFATDIDDVVLSRASEGIYHTSAFAGLDQQLIEKYFRKNGDQYKVKDKVRKSMVFVRHNLFNDPPFTRLHLVSCRNLLIYFKEEAQNKFQNLAYLALKLNGFLFLGPSEGLGNHAILYLSVSRQWKIYQKISDEVKCNLFSKHYQSGYLGQKIAQQRVQKSSSQTSGRLLSPEVYAAYVCLLEDYVPASVLVSREMDCVHFFGDSSEIFRFKPGPVRANLRNLVDHRIATAIYVSMQKAKKYRQVVDLPDTKGDLDGVDKSFRIRVKVIDFPKSSRESLYLVSIAPAAKDGSSQRGGFPSPPSIQSMREINYLETELKRTKEILQNTIEEIEATNVELQSTNEELLNSNEELQSTNEELHSVNEELYTVNAEYQKKIEELSQLREDEENLLKSTEIGTIFLDNELKIRKFTPAVTSYFHLMPQDIGRPLEHFSHAFLGDEFLVKLKDVLQDKLPREMEVESQNGRLFMLRMLPYKSYSKNKNGAVLTFTEITGFHNAIKILKNEALFEVLAVEKADSGHEAGDCLDLGDTAIKKEVLVHASANHQMSDELRRNGAEPPLAMLGALEYLQKSCTFSAEEAKAFKIVQDGARISSRLVKNILIRNREHRPNQTGTPKLNPVENSCN